jgi:hypothetical protein
MPIAATESCIERKGKCEPKADAGGAKDHLALEAVYQRSLQS